MTFALLLVGVLFGIALTLTVCAFALLSMDAGVSEGLRLIGLGIRTRLLGTRSSPAPKSTLVADQDLRVRGLQEEVRILQKLVEQERTASGTHADEARRLRQEISSLRAELLERERRLAAAEATMREHGADLSELRDQLARRSAELAKSERERKDLETELSVLHSDSARSAVTTSARE